MSVKVEKKEKNIIEMEIEVLAEKFEEGLKKSFQKNAGKFNVPGFRKGKAPRNIVERYYGEEVLYDDAINIVCAEAYEKAVEENNIDPVDRPEIDIKEIGKGKNLIFTASVTVKPEVTLGEYKGVEVEKVEAVVTDEDVEKEIKTVAEKSARMISVEDRGIEKGDMVNIDFKGFIDGELFEGGSADGHTLEIGSGQFIEGFEDQLIGANLADDVEVKVTFPEDYGKPELAGKEATFEVIINDIKYKELPEIDDEFAKDVSEFDTLEEYKEDLRKKLLETAQHKAEHEVEDRIVGKVVDNAEVDIPQVMVERQIDNNLREFDRRLRYQGLDLEKYIQILGNDIASFRKQFEERSRREVKVQLVLEKVTETENIQASEEEVEEEMGVLAKNSKYELEDFKQHLTKDDIEYIKDSVKIKKTVDFLVQNGKII